MKTKIYFRKGDRITVQHGRAEAVEAIVARIEGVGYRMVATVSGSDLGSLKPEGWWPEGHMSLGSIENTKWVTHAFSSSQGGAMQLTEALQDKIVEYFQ